ncbi:MAG: carbon-nitrogen hydrolase family protein [Candidatus Woesearchaeota archaeon]
MGDLDMIKIAMGQLLVEGGEPERNFERAEKMCKEAQDKEADLIIFPEAIDFAWTHPSCYKEAVPIPGSFSDKFCEMATQYNLHICVGLTERREDGRLYNTALLIDDKGKIILKYHKINLLEVEQPFYEVGDRLGVVDTKFGKIGVNICSDNYMESVHIGKTLGAMGAQIILSPASWTVDYSVTEEDDPYKDKWIKPLSYIAYLYDALVISTTSVGYIVGGPYEGKKKIGRSLAVNGDGIIKEGQFNEFAGEVIFLETRIPKREEKGTALTRKIREKGIVPEVERWERKYT